MVQLKTQFEIKTLQCPITKAFPLSVIQNKKNQNKVIKP